MTRLRIRIGLAATIALVSLWAFAEASQFHPLAQSMPRFAAAGGALSAMILLAMDLRTYVKLRGSLSVGSDAMGDYSEGTPLAPFDWSQIARFTAWFAWYVVLVALLSMYPATFVFLFHFLWRETRVTWFAALSVSLVVVGVMYIFFLRLGLVLPPSVLF